MTEEVFLRLKELVDNCNKCNFSTCEQCEISWSDVQKIRYLLDLYNKQKEELETEKHYAKVYENMVKDYEKICIEKNKKIEELEEEIDQISKNKWEDWLEANE